MVQSGRQLGTGDHRAGLSHTTACRQGRGHSDSSGAGREGIQYLALSDEMKAHHDTQPPKTFRNTIPLSLDGDKLKAFCKKKENSES